jgi:microcystin-dependent protein
MWPGFRIINLALLSSFPVYTANGQGAHFQSAFFHLNRFIPKDAVVFLNAASCPPGWTAYTSLNGRAILGAGSGNTDINGTSLTARSYGVAGGREFTTGIPASSSAGASFVAAATKRLSTINPVTSYYYTPYTGLSDIHPMENISADTNIPPMVVRTACKATKNTGVPSSLSTAVNASSCPTGWNQDTNLNGRTPFGTGSGNSDQDGNSLSARTLAQTSGQEYTVLMASSNPASISAPGPTVTLGSIPSPEVVYTLSTDPAAVMTSVGGDAADSNMPPFVALPYCQPATPRPYLPPKTVMAFDSATCPAGWSVYAEGKGRFIFGSGGGNADQAGTTLTTRTVSQTGGIEYTPAVRAMNAMTAPYKSSSPTADSFLGLSGTPGKAYSTGAADTTLGGAKADSNMPPYFTLTWCQIPY